MVVAVEPYSENMRASDADRDDVAERLREALAEGRITPVEHSERLDAVYRARTYGDLVPITRDLPRHSGTPAVPGRRSPRPLYGRDRVGGEPGSRFSLALMGGSQRGGSWVVPAAYSAFAMMGGVELDLREARFTEPVVTIYASAIMGAVEITVPDDIEVRVNGLGIMGAYGTEGPPSSVTEPGAPVVRVTGIAIMGAVLVKPKPRKHQRPDGPDGLDGAGGARELGS